MHPVDITKLPRSTAPRRDRRAPRLVGLAAASAVTITALVSGSTLGASGDSEALLDVVAADSPAVVTIDVTSGASNAMSQRGFGNRPIPQMQGTGSGVIIDPDGLILTNRHVAGDATSVTVTTADGRTYPGTTVGVDTLTDFAFVKIDATGLPAAPLGDSSNLQVGQIAIAMGDPLGELPGSVTTGIVSGLDRTISVSDSMGLGGTTLRHLIQTDAPINPGNSGGPLLDGDGMVIGIDTAEAGMASGIGFALPIDLAKPIIEQVRAGQPIERPWMGIAYQEIDAQVAADASVPVDAGAWIQAPVASGQSAVVAGSPAATAGLQDGDIITALDGQSVDAQHQLDLLLLQHAPGDILTLDVLRDGQAMTLDMTLGTRPDAV